MAKTKVHCGPDLTGVENALVAGSKYIVSFDGKTAYVEEITGTGTVAFVDGDLTDLTPAVGNVTVITDAGPVEVTPATGATHVIAVGDSITIDDTGIVTDYTPA